LRAVFADTGYWIALLNRGDALHAKATTVSAALGSTRIVTTEAVLTELLNNFSEKGSALRAAAAKLVEALQTDPNSKVVPLSRIQFRSGLKDFTSYKDKSWSHTDCVSFQIMREDKLTDALTYDKHFEQAGFRALLRETS